MWSLTIIKPVLVTVFVKVKVDGPCKVELQNRTRKHRVRLSLQMSCIFPLFVMHIRQKKKIKICSEKSYPISNNPNTVQPSNFMSQQKLYYYRMVRRLRLFFSFRYKFTVLLMEIENTLDMSAEVKTYGGIT